MADASADGTSAAGKRCWLCGTHRMPYQLVADGGSACEDLRWYCRDTRACTERWTRQPLARDNAVTGLRPVQRVAGPLAGAKGEP